VNISTHTAPTGNPELLGKSCSYSLLIEALTRRIQHPFQTLYQHVARARSTRSVRVPSGEDAADN
jgi:hypothetical protein